MKEQEFNGLLEQLRSLSPAEQQALRSKMVANLRQPTSDERRQRASDLAKLMRSGPRAKLELTTRQELHGRGSH